jgi:hypothetical protein
VTHPDVLPKEGRLVLQDAFPNVRTSANKQTAKETPMGTVFILGFIGLVLTLALAPDPEQQKRKKRRQSYSKRRYPYA